MASRASISGMPPFLEGEGKEISCEFIMNEVIKEFIISMTAKPAIDFFIFALMCR